jgi:hypothetical protein
MSKAENFKKWCAKRQGHPPQIIAALEAVTELENKLRLAESVISKVIPSDANQRQLIHSYQTYKTTSKTGNTEHG